MLKKLAFIILSLMAGVVRAQDYVVTAQNDTLKGEVRILSYDVIDRIEAKVDKKKIHLTAIQVRAVVIHSEVFHPIRTDKGYRMMKLVEAGYVSKYKARSPSNSYDTDYLVLRDGRSTEVPNISFKKVMIDFLKDCSSIKEIIEAKELTKKKLDELLHEYNACIENQTIAVDVPAQVSDQDPLMIALSTLQSKISKDNALTSRKDAIDVLSDITSKVKNNQKIPNYLMDGLKGFLKESPDYQNDLDTITALLKDK